jgi:hypothetical protein
MIELLQSEFHCCRGDQGEQVVDSHQCIVVLTRQVFNWIFFHSIATVDNHYLRFPYGLNVFFQDVRRNEIHYYSHFLDILILIHVS